MLKKSIFALMFVICASAGPEALAVSAGAEEAVRGERASQPAEELVSQRAGARWQALIKQDYDAAYQYLSPGERSLTSLELYKKRSFGRALSWQSADVAAVACESDVCSVDIRVSYVYFGQMKEMMGQSTESLLHERWLQVDGQWWFMPEK